MSLEFYLGTHHPHWLARLDVPLFVSRRSLCERKTLPRATAPWALDSGGFTELSMNGTWRTTPQEYAQEARRFRDEIGGMRWAAPQDWMCEPIMIAKTGLTVADHQRRTVDNYIELTTIAPDVPWIAVLQGWSETDYRDHVDQYAAAGVNLVAHGLVGIGTVCRRQATGSAVATMSRLASAGIRLHGFGVKIQGLKKASNLLCSADSMAWSVRARKSEPLPGHKHKSCANCVEFALAWREKVLSTVRTASRAALQSELFQ